MHSLLLIGLLTICALLPSLAQPPVNLGVNLDERGAFVDVMKHTSRFIGVTMWDANGWPQSDFSLVSFDGRPVAEWTQAIDDPEQYRVDYSGRYLAHFKGRATIVAQGTAVSVENMSYDATTNTSVFDLVVGAANAANHALVILQFSATQRTASDAVGTGITNLVVNRPGYDRFSTQVFTDVYVDLCKSADFTCYRYYNVQNIWSGEPVFPITRQWENRKRATYASQTSHAGQQGTGEAWCWDHIVTLANTLNKDIWICVHMSCDSAYVTSLAQMLKDSLNPSINIYVENSNEVWSPTQLTHGPYNAAAAAARGITFDDNYAHRTVQLSQWFATVFGADAINNRVRVVLAGQHGYHGRSDNHLRYIDRTFGAPKNHIYATSTALYFGSTRADNPDPLAINEGMIADINNQIANTQAATYRKAHIDKANLWDLPGGCTSYEGGPHVPAGGGTTNLSAQISAHRTGRMADVTKHNYRQGWQDLQGGLAMYFTLVSGYNRYGCWGITDDPSKPHRNYKMRAIQELTKPASTDVEDTDYERTDYERAGYERTGHDSIEAFDMLGRRVVGASKPAGLYIMKIGDRCYVTVTSP